MIESPCMEKKKPSGHAAKKNGIGEMADKAMAIVRPKNRTVAWIMLLATALLALSVFKLVLDSEASALWKFAGSAIIMAASGEFMRRLMKWDGSWGLIFFRDRSGLGWIDRTARRFAPAWMALADLGTIFGYGLLSYFVFGEEQKKDKKRLAFLYIVGMPALLVFATIIAPLSLSVMVALVQQNDFSSASAQIRGSIPGQGAIASFKVLEGTLTITPVMLAMTAIVIAGGMASLTAVSIVMYAFIIAGQGIMGLSGAGPGLSKAAPGGSLILPGINLPFLEGIIALAVLLVVHELAHGFLARLAKVRLDSAGVVFFGVLPFGAFVDPDEKEMGKLPGWSHNRILAAGSAANFLTSIAAVFLLIYLFIFTSGLRLEGWNVVAGTLPANTIVYAINGTQFYGQNISLAPNTPVQVETSRGIITRTTNSNGKVGVNMEYAGKWNLWGAIYAPGFEWMRFLLTTLALVFALNMLVGTVNLLPIQFFDGYHIVKRVLGKGIMLTALSWLIAGAFVLNMLPWLFR